MPVQFVKAHIPPNALEDTHVFWPHRTRDRLLGFAEQFI